MLIYCLCCLIAEHEGLVVVLIGLRLQRRRRRHPGRLRVEGSLDTFRSVPVPGRSRVLRDWIPRECRYSYFFFNRKESSSDPGFISTINNSILIAFSTQKAGEDSIILGTPAKNLNAGE